MASQTKLFLTMVNIIFRIHEAKWNQAYQMFSFLRHRPKYVPGVIVQRLAPNSYSVEVKDNCMERHVDHLHKLGETTHERKYLPEVEQDQAEEEEDIYLPFSNSREIRPLDLNVHTINANNIQDLAMKLQGTIHQEIVNHQIDLHLTSHTNCIHTKS